MKQHILPLLLALAAASPAWAAGTPAPLRFDPAPGVKVQATLQEDGHIAVQRLPSGARQVLDGVADAEGNARLSAEDVDFDGHPDLVARAAVGMVNEAVAVHRFDPATGRFQPLTVNDHGQSQCGGWMGLAVDVPTQTLSSSCRSGPMWYTDLYRFEGRRPYLYRAERVLHGSDALEAVLFIKQSADTGPLAVWSTYDPRGKVLETGISDGLVAPAGKRLLAFSAFVVPERLPLYTRPGDATTRRYLVREDRVELLDEKDGWYQVRYANPKRGDILGWVNADL